MKKELIVAENPKSRISESLKIIKTNLEFTAADDKIKNILVTSSLPGEGKSFISANLAVTCAQVGSNVLLVDCDMRRGRQHKIFDVSNDRGLSNLLIDNIEDNYKDYIIKTDIKRVSVLPCGVTPPNPTKLLLSNKFKKLVNLLDKNYDLIIFDGVPIGGLSDSLVLAELVDKIVIVAAAKQTPVKCLEDTKKSLENFKDKIAGVVLNKVAIKENSYYNNYYNKYYS